uniref:Uncharacterized protein n=1 Tax=Anguilla anguilla TaxID=7936 RepID=A0A0E9QD26_ANGAN
MNIYGIQTKTSSVHQKTICGYLKTQWL